MKDGVADRRPNDPHDHHKYDGGRQQHERWSYSTKDERMKDQASHGHGRSSRRDDEDDRHIREQEGRKIKDDGYRDANRYIN